CCRRCSSWVSPQMPPCARSWRRPPAAKAPLGQSTPTSTPTSYATSLLSGTRRSLRATATGSESRTRSAAGRPGLVAREAPVHRAPRLLHLIVELLLSQTLGLGPYMRARDQIGAAVKLLTVLVDYLVTGSLHLLDVRGGDLHLPGDRLLRLLTGAAGQRPRDHGHAQDNTNTDSQHSIHLPAHLPPLGGGSPKGPWWWPPTIKSIDCLV